MGRTAVAAGHPAVSTTRGTAPPPLPVCQRLPGQACLPGAGTAAPQAGSEAAAGPALLCHHRLPARLSMHRRRAPLLCTKSPLPAPSLGPTRHSCCFCNGPRLVMIAIEPQGAAQRQALLPAHQVGGRAQVAGIGADHHGAAAADLHPAATSGRVWREAARQRASSRNAQVLAYTTAPSRSKTTSTPCESPGPRVPGRRAAASSQWLAPWRCRDTPQPAMYGLAPSLSGPSPARCPCLPGPRRERRTRARTSGWRGPSSSWGVAVVGAEDGGGAAVGRRRVAYLRVAHKARASNPGQPRSCRLGQRFSLGSRWPSRPMGPSKLMF